MSGDNFVREKNTEEMRQEIAGFKDTEALISSMNTQKQNSALYTMYGDWLDNKLKEKGKKYVDIYESGLAISESTVKRVRNGKQDPRQSRDSLILIGLAIGLSEEEMNEGLRLAGADKLNGRFAKDVAILAYYERGKDKEGLDGLNWLDRVLTSSDPKWTIFYKGKEEK